MGRLLEIVDSATNLRFHIEAYLRPFNLAGSFDYVSSGAYATELSFQRFLQPRTERMRERGERVDLWK